MNCQKCGFKLPDYAKFCIECGAELNAGPKLTISECPRCKAFVNLQSKYCSKCGIEIEDLKRQCAKCGNSYLFGQRFCSICKTPLLNESMGLIFNDIGIVYFNLKDSENIIKAEEFFNQSKYLESFNELQKEQNLAQIYLLNKKDLNWIQKCLLQVAKSHKSYLSQVINLSEQIFNEGESKNLKIEIYENLSKKAKDESDSVSASQYYRFLYSLTKKEEYKKKIKSLFYERQVKKRKLFLLAALKLILFGLFFASLADFLFIALFGYKFPLRHSGVRLSEVTGASVWRFIPLFFFIGVSISISYWLAFRQVFSGKKRNAFFVSLVVNTILFLVGGVCWGEILNESDAVAIMIFILVLLSYGIIQMRGIKDIFDKNWKRNIWPILTPFLFYAAIIPGKIATPLYNQPAQVDFVGIGFYAFSFILCQGILIILFNRHVSRPNPKAG